MKRKRTTRNSLKSCSSSESLSQTESIEAFHLPDDCWISIFREIIDGDDDNNLCYLQPLSLASKHFLSITNRLRFSLTISNPTLQYSIPTLFHRFLNLTSLHITIFQGKLNSLLCQISKFPFKLKSLKLSNQTQFPAKGLRALSKTITTVTSFTYLYIDNIDNNDFVLVSHCFPLLEELDMQHNRMCFQGVEVGLKAMLTALPKLRKINLSGYYFINDLLLLYLCNNCEFLEDIIMLKCPLLTRHGIASAIRQRPTLRSLCSYQCGNISSHFIDSLLSLKGLTCLDLSYANISDELFTSIATEDLPWRRLVLQYCNGYSFAGIFSLLSKCRCIQHLDLKKADFLIDHHVVNLSLFLADLVSINLSECCKLTDSALFTLVNKCPLLSDIKMEHTSIGENIVENSNSLLNFVLNPPLKSLYLAHSSLLTDESLIMMASLFPNLQLLDLSNCDNISGEGICQVLTRCCKIRHLNLDYCSGVKLRGMNLEFPKLEVLNLSHTSIDDETLYVISKNCCGLWQLLLESCGNVTNKGVKHVVENCSKLREINLKSCDKVCADIVDSMYTGCSYATFGLKAISLEVAA
ncbi:hypothetical protein TSUD_259110 [Trifolium subterraneum]|uniref:F-box/LRR-repeat protein 15-like leucin rich repeat domain-containing protein n=1 Tax=Trifolium subterraneum TaxID=3900 RepID=A0A2Z6MTX8_TRISU|nr:hypothetical protein TSUD_259110 [Trifolium subterraneum]